MKRKLKIVLIYTVLIILIALMLGGAVNIFMLAWSQRYIVPHTNPEGLPGGFEPDLILVLGAKAIDDKTVSLILGDRLDAGLILHEHYGKKVPLLLSGGDEEGASEVNAMALYVSERGVDESDILIDGGGVSTYASVSRAKQEFNAEKMIIVTQDFHMARCVYIARSLGIEAYGVTSDMRIYFRSNHIREFFARIKDVFNVLINA